MSEKIITTWSMSRKEMITVPQEFIDSYKKELYTPDYKFREGGGDERTVKNLYAAYVDGNNWEVSYRDFIADEMYK